MASVSLATKIDGPVAVIGDVHGQVDKLLAVLDKLQRLPDYSQRWIVFIGDLVDRGPDPCGAVEIFAKLLKSHPRTTAIEGNHEFAMSSALGWHPSLEFTNWGERWVTQYDAQTTFESYGADFGNLEDLAAKVPPHHRELLINLPWAVEHPRYLFVHAGLDPNQPYELQRRVLKARDFTLSRPPWLCSKSFVELDPPNDCPPAVVSGHVRVPEVVIRPRRLLIDTTGGTEGHLSCVLLPENRIISSGEATAPVASSSQKSKSWWKLW